MFKRIFLLFFIFLIGFTLVACEDFNVDDVENGNLITSIQQIDSVITVKFLDGTSKILGKPEKDVQEGEVGISQIEFTQTGSFVVTYTNNETENLGFIVGTVGDPIELEVSGMFVKWRFKGSNDPYQNLISLGLLSSQDLKANLDVRFSIQDNQLKWKDIDDNDWRLLSTFLNIAMLTGVTDLEIVSIIIDENDQAVIIFDNGYQVSIDLPLEYSVVVFKDADGTVLSTQKIGLGYDATPPEIEDLEGFTISWDKDFTNVVEDLEVNLVYQADQYQIAFDFEGLDSVDVLFGSPVGELPVPLVPDVEFLRWVDSDGNTVDENTIFTWLENITLTPVFSKSSYLVNVYTKDLDGEYTLFSSTSHFGVADTLVIFEDITKDGYQFNEDLSVISGIILEDGSLELNLYFDSLTFELIFVGYEDIVFFVDYGLPAMHLPALELEDHRFIGWYLDEELLEPFDPTEPYLKLENTHLYPKFELGALYKFRYFYSGTLRYVDEDWAADGTRVEAEFEMPYGYKLDPATPSTLSSLVWHDRNNNFNIYLVPDQFVVTWFTHDGEVIAEHNYNYLSYVMGTPTFPNRTAEGFKFIGWEAYGVVYLFGEISNYNVQVLENVSIYAAYEELDVDYNVITKFMDGDTLISQSHIVLTDKAFSDVATDVVDVLGYTLDLDRSVLETTLTTTSYEKSLQIVYQINKRSVYFTVDGSYVEIFTGNYGDNVVFPADPVKEHHNFVGWLFNGKIVTEMTVRNIDVGVHALFEDALATYYIEYYVEKEDGTFKYFAGHAFTGIVGHEVDFVHLNDIEDRAIDLPDHFEFDEDNFENVLSGVVIENEPIPFGQTALTLKGYYLYKNHTVTYRLGDSVWGEDFIYVYRHGEVVDLGAETEILNPDFSNYNLIFNGWYLNVGDDPQFVIEGHEIVEDITVYASLEDVSWTVTLLDGDEVIDEVKVFHNDYVYLPRLDDIDLINFYGPYHQFITWMDEENNEVGLFFLFNHYRDVTLYAKWKSTGSLYTFDYRDATPGSHLVTITNYFGRNIEETIPRLIGGHVVGFIESGVFTGNPYVQKITTHVAAKDQSFNEMPRLKEVMIVQYDPFSNLFIPISLGFRAFADNPKLETVSMRYSGVIRFDTAVFADNPSLREVSLPVSMPSIPDYMFYNAVSLESVTLTSVLKYDNHPVNPSSGHVMVNAITEIGVSAFQNTPNLKTVFDYSFEAFGDDRYPKPTIEGNGANLLNQLTVISNNAFKDSGLEQMTFPDSLVRISDNAFENTNLVNVEFGPSLLRIGYQAFKNTKLVDLVIPDNVLQIDGEAFNDISTLETITILGDNSLALPGNYTFFGGSNNTSLKWALLGRGVSTSRGYTPIVTQNETFAIYTFNNTRNTNFQPGYLVYTSGQFRVNVYGEPSPMPSN